MELINSVTLSEKRSSPGWVLACVSATQLGLARAGGAARAIGTAFVCSLLGAARGAGAGLRLQKVKALNDPFAKSKVHLPVLVMFKYLKCEVTRCCFTTHLLRPVSLPVLPLNCADIAQLRPAAVSCPAPQSLRFSDFFFPLVSFSVFPTAHFGFYPQFLDCCWLPLLCPNPALPLVLCSCRG